MGVRQGARNMGQTACKPGSVPPAVSRRRGGHSSGPPIAGRFARPTRTARSRDAPAQYAKRAHRPYSVLLQAGLAMPSRSPGPRWALTPPFHPCPRPRPEAVCFLWRYPWGRPRRALPAALSLWSPDFPHPSRRRSATARPSGCGGRCALGRAGSRAQQATRGASCTPVAIGLTVNHMVHYSAARLDASFAALADATRRGVLEQLGRADASVSELADKFHMTLTGMKKHVRVLEAAGLVATEKVGRVRTCRLGPRELTEETAWIEAHRQLWAARFDALDKIVKDLKQKEEVDGRQSRE